MEKKNNCQVHFMGLQYNNFTHIPSLLTIMTVSEQLLFNTN